MALTCLCHIIHFTLSSNLHKDWGVSYHFMCHERERGREKRERERDKEKGEREKESESEREGG